MEGFRVESQVPEQPVSGVCEREWEHVSVCVERTSHPCGLKDLFFFFLYPIHCRPIILWSIIKANY